MNRTHTQFAPRTILNVILSGARSSHREERAESKNLRLLFSRRGAPLHLSIASASARIFLAAAFLAFFLALPAQAVVPAAPADSPSSAGREAMRDPVLKAMLTELDRSMSRLELKGFAKPSFIQYRIEEADDFQTQALFGASTSSSRAHQRVVRATVRVGDYKTDSSSSTRGDGVIALAAIDNDPIALRSALWQATDQAYKNALSAYAQKQAELKQVQTPPQSDDFSREKPVVSLAAAAALAIDENAWTNRVARSSGLYRTDKTVSATQNGIQYATASFHSRATTTWLVTSEGAIVRKSTTQVQQSFAAGTQAPDGMRLDRSYSSSGVTLADLDSEAVFNRHAVEEIASLADLRKAPLVEEEYHGPLLMSADAAADTLRSLLATAVTATRPALGTEARTNGPFASSFHARVLPDSMSVIDDPGLKTFNGKSLLGAYEIDDEAVPAQTVTLVNAGRLENYLIGRQPVRDFPQSNGHGRASITGPARPTAGVLKITAQNGLSMDELNQKLLAMARDRGLQSVYYVETLGGERIPRLLYRVSADGRRELVRGAVLADIDERALRSSIDAAGKDLWADNSFGDPAVTVLAPALLFEDATVRRANAKNDKLPFYPPPE
jgi:TldD protein